MKCHHPHGVGCNKPGFMAKDTELWMVCESSNDTKIIEYTLGLTFDLYLFLLFN